MWEQQMGYINVVASKTEILPGEIVTFRGYASPIEDISVQAYVNGVLKGMWTIYLKTLGIDYLDLKPSLIGTVTVWKFKGVDSGATCPDITITVITSPTPPDIITLTASNIHPLPGEIVTFTATTTPAVTETATLYAYVNGSLKSHWGLSIVNGTGRSEDLVPSAIADIVEWQVVDQYGVKSNTVKTEVYTPPQQPQLLTLTVSNTMPDIGEVVTFTVMATPAVTESSTLYAYVSGELKGGWHLPIVNGVGTIQLAPSQVGKIVDWVVVDSFGVRSNTVTTGVKTPPTPPPGKGTLTCHAYMDSEEVKASVEVVNVGKFTTPFSLDLNPGIYGLKATYDKQSAAEIVTITEGQTTPVTFQFVKEKKWWEIIADWWSSLTLWQKAAIIVGSATAVAGIAIVLARKR